MNDIAKAIERLRNCAEADHDGVTVFASRPAIDKVCDEIERLQGENDRLKKAIAESCEDDRQQILERGWGGCMEAHKLQDRVAELEGYLNQLLNQCAGDHMTACDKTMGDSHPCTCGATEIRKHYRRLRYDA